MRTSNVLLAGGLFAMASAMPHEGHSHDETVEIFAPMFDTQDLVAASLREEGDATVYLVGCPEGTDSTECGIPIPMEYTGSPKTAVYTASAPDNGLCVISSSM